MNHLNSILIEGVLVQNPVIWKSEKGTLVCTFSMVFNRFFEQDSELEKEENFFEVETWSKLAENCCNHGHKGCSVRVVGRLKQIRWTDKAGRDNSKIVIVAEHVEFRAKYPVGDSQATQEKDA